MKKNALLIIDLINEIVAENGVLGCHGYFSFMSEFGILTKINGLINFCRDTDFAIPIFIKVSFSNDYREKLSNSLIFKDIDSLGIFREGTWSSDFYKDLAILPTDIVVTKNAISPFYGTNLQMILKNLRIEKLFICGVSTNLAVESTARDAHDRGYCVSVIEDCCISNNHSLHANSIANVKNFAEIINFDSLTFNKNHNEN